MRKADYQKLAEIVSRDLRILRNDQDDRAVGERNALQRIAREFAASASVDAAAFLTACGMADHVRPPCRLFSDADARAIASKAAGR